MAHKTGKALLRSGIVGLSACAALFLLTLGGCSLTCDQDDRIMSTSPSVLVSTDVANCANYCDNDSNCDTATVRYNTGSSYSFTCSCE